MCVTFVVFTACERCTRPISTKPGIYGSGRVWANARGAFRRGPSRGSRGRWADVDFVVCFRWGGIFSCFSGNTFFSNSCTSTRPLAARDPDSSQRRPGERAPTVSQSAHRELAPIYPHQVHRLVCSHQRNLASAVDQDSVARSQPV